MFSLLLILGSVPRLAGPGLAGPDWPTRPGWLGPASRLGQASQAGLGQPTGRARPASQPAGRPGLAQPGPARTNLTGWLVRRLILWSVAITFPRVWQLITPSGPTNSLGRDRLFPGVWPLIIRSVTSGGVWPLIVRSVTTNCPDVTTNCPGCDH